jgi:hypothetical protein
MRCTLAAGADLADALADKSKRTIRRGCVAQVDLARGPAEDFVVADGKTRGPGFPGENRWKFFLEQFALQRRPPAAGRETPTIPGRHATAKLVMVQAPILRTRLDPGFAHAIRDRLAGSAKFQAQLRATGAGGDVVAVAFPRPGPNWYREHHGSPQISVFVILARLHQGADLHDLLHHPSKRDLRSAFITDLDFKIDPPTDSVTLINPIGLWRDLEERWNFFLSGLGGKVVHPHRH